MIEEYFSGDAMIGAMLFERPLISSLQPFDHRHWRMWACAAGTQEGSSL